MLTASTGTECRLIPSLLHFGDSMGSLGGREFGVYSVLSVIGVIRWLSSHDPASEFVGLGVKVHGAQSVAVAGVGAPQE